MVGFPGGHGEPDMSDDSGARRVENLYRLPDLDRTIILVSAGSIIAGLLERPVILRQRVVGQADGSRGRTGRRLSEGSSGNAESGHAAEKSSAKRFAQHVMMVLNTGDRASGCFQTIRRQAQSNCA